MNTSPQIHIIENKEKKDKNMIIDYGNVAMNQCQYQNIVPSWVRFIESAIPFIEEKDFPLQFAYSPSHLSIIFDNRFFIHLVEKWNSIHIIDIHPFFSHIIKKNDCIGKISDPSTLSSLTRILNSCIDSML